MNLPPKDKQHYFNLRKGYEGEVKFDSYTEKLQCDCIILNDLLLRVNSTTFQIDSLIITLDRVFLYEVKNFKGDYYYDSDLLYKKPKIEVINPLLQLQRSESLLRQLLLSLGFNLPIDSSVVFINPEFTLYQAPLNEPFIFSTQLNHYFKQQNTISTKIDSKHKMLADQLVSLHMADSPFTQVAPYEYNRLRKGISCLNCDSFSLSIEGQKCVCKECGYVEVVAAAVMRCVHEFNMLFPKQEITTNIIHDWCQVVNSKKRIRRILASHFNRIGVHRWTLVVLQASFLSLTRPMRDNSRRKSPCFVVHRTL
ncbi:nuclease-related domain-containing protein [Salinibacillus xinjiangensis]|nr:nuclease-related domain-containing protein [Salinibacillus xinjiangensis]